MVLNAAEGFDSFLLGAMKEQKAKWILKAMENVLWVLSLLLLKSEIFSSPAFVYVGCVCVRACGYMHGAVCAQGACHRAGTGVV